MVEYTIGFAWMGVVAWAIILTSLSKRLSWLEKVIILIAIILSFSMAVLANDKYYQEIFVPDPEGEYVYI